MDIRLCRGWGGPAPPPSAGGYRQLQPQVWALSCLCTQRVCMCACVWEEGWLPYADGAVVKSVVTLGGPSQRKKTSVPPSGSSLDTPGTPETHRDTHCGTTRCSGEWGTHGDTHRPTTWSHVTALGGTLGGHGDMGGGQGKKRGVYLRAVSGNSGALNAAL